MAFLRKYSRSLAFPSSNSSDASIVAASGEWLDPVDVTDIAEPPRDCDASIAISCVPELSWTKLERCGEGCVVAAEGGAGVDWLDQAYDEGDDRLDVVGCDFLLALRKSLSTDSVSFFADLRSVSVSEQRSTAQHVNISFTS